MSKKLNVLLIMLVSVIIILLPINAHAASVVTPGVTYRTQVQNVGWQSYVSNGTTSGTVGRSLRLEAINIKGTNLPTGVGITYEVQCQNIGWSQGWVKDGALAGTVGKSLRLEAIKINLTGANAAAYSVEYQTQVQNIGWQGWVENGELSGTAGKSLRLEGIQIKVVPKGYMDIGKYLIIKDVFYGTYQLTLNNVTITSERNEYSGVNPVEVYKINYTYKLLAKPTGLFANSVGLWIDGFSSVLDSSNTTGDSAYPDNIINNPVFLSIVGSTCNADTFVSVNHVTNSLTILEDYSNADFSQNHATFNFQTK